MTKNDIITKVALEAMRLSEGVESKKDLIIPTFDLTELPADAIEINDVDDVPDHLGRIMSYMKQRYLALDDYKF